MPKELLDVPLIEKGQKDSHKLIRHYLAAVIIGSLLINVLLFAFNNWNQEHLLTKVLPRIDERSIRFFWSMLVFFTCPVLVFHLIIHLAFYFFSDLRASTNKVLDLYEGKRLAHIWESWLVFVSGGVVALIWIVLIVGVLSGICLLFFDFEFQHMVIDVLDGRGLLVTTIIYCITFLLILFYELPTMYEQLQKIVLGIEPEGNNIEDNGNIDY